MQSSTPNIESLSLTNRISHAQSTHNAIISNSVAMAILTLKKHYLGPNPSQEDFNSLYMQFMNWINHLQVEDFFCASNIESNAELSAEIKIQLPSLVANFMQRIDEPVHPQFDVVTLYQPNQFGIYTEERVVLTLKEVASLFYAAYVDDSKFNHAAVVSQEQIQQDRAQRMQSFYRYLKTINAGICHTGVRHELICLLNHTYESIHIIEEASLTAICALRDGLNTKLHNYIGAQPEAITKALCIWMTQSNPAELLSLLDPEKTIKDSIAQIFIQHGSNPESLNLNSLITNLESQLTFSASSEHQELRFIAELLNSTATHPALEIVQEWIKNTFIFNSPVDLKIISGFYVIYKAFLNLQKENNLLIVTGTMQQSEIDAVITLCNTYLQSIINANQIIAPTLQILQEISEINKKIKQAKQDNLAEQITNFFSIWFADNPELQQQLYAILLNESQHKKILVNDSTLTKMIKTNSTLTHCEFSPYEINRILLTAIIQQPHTWSELFANTLSDLIAFIKSFETNHLAIELKRTSYPDVLIKQIEYLQSLRTDNPLVRPEEFVILLPQQVKSAEEWINNIHKYTTSQQYTQLYNIYKIFIQPKILEYIDLTESNLTACDSYCKFIPVINLIELLSSTNTKTQEHATCALANLAANSTNQDTFRELDAIRPLIGLLLSSANIKTQEYATLALANLAANSTNQDTFREIDAIRPLIGLLLSSANINTQQYATHALANLAINHINKDTLRELDAIRPLIELLLSSANIKTQEYATLALARLTVNSINQDTLRDFNAIEPLVNLLSSSTNIKNQKNATIALANLAGNSTNRDILRKLNAIEPLIDLLSSPNPDTQQYATIALANLSISSTNKDTLRELNAIKPLIDLLSSENTNIQPHATFALANLTANPINSNTLIKLNAITPLIKLLSSTNSYTQLHATRALAHLIENFTNQETLETIIAIIIPFIELLSSKNIDTQLYATLALSNLAINFTNHDALRDLKAIEPLIGLLSSTNPDTQLYATLALAYLTENETNQNTFIKLNAIEPLIKLLYSINIDTQLNATPINIETQEHATRALANLAFNFTNQDTLRKLNAIQPLIDLLSSKNLDTQLHATRALANLAENSINKNTLRELHAITPLIDLLSSSSIQIQHEAKRALITLAYNSDLNKKIIYDLLDENALISLWLYIHYTRIDQFITSIDYAKLNSMITNIDLLCKYLRITNIQKHVLSLLNKKLLTSIIKNEQDRQLILQCLPQNLQYKILILFPCPIISNDELSQLYEQSKPHLLFLDNTPSSKTKECYFNAINAANNEDKYHILANYINQPSNASEIFYKKLIEKFNFDVFLHNSSNCNP